MNRRLQTAPDRPELSRVPGPKTGAVLLEVVLALTLFVVAATIIANGMQSSVAAVERLRLDTHAANLAVTVMSELQMKIRPLEPAGPESFNAPFEDWTWKVEVGSVDSEGMVGDSLRGVEVIVRHNDPPAVRRLSQLFKIDPSQANGAKESAEKSNERDKPKKEKKNNRSPIQEDFSTP